MKKHLLICTLLFILIVGFASIAYASTHTFYLINHSGVSIHAVYISPASSNNWGSNILSDVLYDGYQIPINLYGYSSYWDLMIENQYGTRVFWRNISLNNLDSYTLLP